MHTDDPPPNPHEAARRVAEMHEANRRHWEAAAPKWRRLREEDGAWRRLSQEPHLAFEGQALETIRKFVGDLRGKRVCVVASGDNYAAFALAGLGAHVTSVDISDQQLENAASRAAEVGLSLRFVQADAANLRALEDNAFDLVFSSNGFFIWLADLPTVHGEIARLLRPGGHYVFYDVHPFQRPWKDQVQPLEMAKSYWERRPSDASPEDATYEFHWTVAEIMNALVGAGLNIRRVVESPAVNSRFWTGPSYGPGTDETLQDWRNNPRAGLPVWLTAAAVKP